VFGGWPRKVADICVFVYTYIYICMLYYLYLRFGWKCRICILYTYEKLMCTRNCKQTVLSGCFNSMIPRDYMKNRCFTQREFKLLVWGSFMICFSGDKSGGWWKIRSCGCACDVEWTLFSPTKPIQSQSSEKSFSLRWHVFKCYVSVRSVPFF